MYIILALFVIITGILLLNIRVRLELDKDKKLLFVGLGQSGSELNFHDRRVHIKLFGIELKSFRMVIRAPRKRPVRKPSKAEKKPEEKKTVEKKAEKTPGRLEQIDFKSIFNILPQTLKAFAKYILEILRSAALEEFNGEITGGFEQPHLTGQTYGYYQALLGAVPALAGRFNYYPVWNEAYLMVALRVSVVLPLYKLLYRTIVLMIRLPLRKIIKLAIGR